MCTRFPGDLTNLCVLQVDSIWHGVSATVSLWDVDIACVTVRALSLVDFTSTIFYRASTPHAWIVFVMATIHTQNIVDFVFLCA